MSAAPHGPLVSTSHAYTCPPPACHNPTGVAAGMGDKQLEVHSVASSVNIDARSSPMGHTAASSVHMDARATVAPTVAPTGRIYMMKPLA